MYDVHRFFKWERSSGIKEVVVQYILDLMNYATTFMPPDSNFHHHRTKAY